MAITKMKRLRLIALEKDRDALLDSLQHAGCVEVSEPDGYLNDEQYAALLHRESAAVAEARSSLTELQHAIDVMQQYAPQKGGLFTPRDQISAADLLDEGARKAVLDKAGKINGHARAIGQLNARETRVRADQQALQPWTACDLPLEDKGSKWVDILLGTVPNTASLDNLSGALDAAGADAEVRQLSEDRELKYLEVMVHRDCRQEALDTLRSFGFSFAQLKDLTGTASANIKLLDQELRDIDAQRQKEIGAIQAMNGSQKELKTGIDRMNQVLASESAKERLLTGGSILFLDGWAAEPELPALESALAKFDCAYELEEPKEDEYPEVPVQLRNSKLIRPLNMVTEMYSLPAYGSVDPNPLIAPFFILFYGIMMADMGYGILMMLASWIIMKKAKPNGPTMRHMIPLMGLCGISTFIWGAVTGGFFGDFLTQVVKITTGKAFALPALFTPLEDTLMILVGSMALGLVHIITGMAVSFVRKIKAGNVMDAVWEEVTWWVVFAGIGLMAVGVTNLVLYLGLVMVVAGPLITGKGFGKVTGIFGSLYNHVTGFFGDILSYSRLMALMLAGSVIAQVFNTLGAIPNNIIFFLIISLAGNALNFALNLLGCYVHDLRLQCLEFFGKFYEDGGKPFRPLEIHTTYVDIK